MTTSQLEKTTVNPLHMRNVMSAVPTCVTVVAGEDRTAPSAMVVGSFVSISVEPALVGFFVGLESTSWPLLRTQHRLGISVLGESKADMVRAITKKDPSRFAANKWTAGPYGEMLIRDAVTHMTGTIDSIQPAGDHEFIVLALESITSGTAEQPLVFQDRRIQTLSA